MMGHDHAQPATAGQAHRGRLALTLALQGTVMVVEVVGAIASGSSALLADAGHMLTDSAGVALALFATWLAARPATQGRTFGLQRAEILAALANALILLVVAVGIVIQGIRRFLEPGEVEAGLMLVVATIGLVVNVIGLLLLRRGQKESLNVRGAYLEVLGDLLGSVAVIVAGVVVAVTGFVRADAIASLLIAGLIVPRVFSLMREVVDVLLEATPRGVDLGEVREHLLSMPGVDDVHDLHAWTITSGVPVLSVHVKVDDEVLRTDGNAAVLDRLHECLSGHFDVAHSTFQIEPTSTGVAEGHQHY